MRSCLLVIAVLAAAGCKDGTGNVTGIVSLEGTPITFGNVVFLSPDGSVVNANIQSDGTYSATQVSPGNAVVTVQTYPLPPQVQPPDASLEHPESMDTRRYVAIPPEYADADRSPLRATVAPGPQTHDITLTRDGK